MIDMFVEIDCSARMDESKNAQKTGLNLLHVCIDRFQRCHCDIRIYLV
jgi:hypothetical protein